jgi:hypothetical protein
MVQSMVCWIWASAMLVEVFELGPSCPTGTFSSISAAVEGLRESFEPQLAPHLQCYQLERGAGSFIHLFVQSALHMHLFAKWGYLSHHCQTNRTSDPIISACNAAWICYSVLPYAVEQCVTTGKYTLPQEISKLLIEKCEIFTYL